MRRLQVQILALLLTLIAVLSSCGREVKGGAMAAKGGGDPDRGKEAIQRYGCTACHNIPGVAGPRGMVGPPLDHLAKRQALAERLPNTPETMIRWLQNPQALDPQSTMPNLGVTPDDARDLAAYLYTLE
jgi:cytochrome c